MEYVYVLYVSVFYFFFGSVAIVCTRQCSQGQDEPDFQGKNSILLCQPAQHTSWVGKIRCFSELVIFLDYTVIPIYENGFWARCYIQYVFKTFHCDDA